MVGPKFNTRSCSYHAPLCSRSRMGLLTISSKNSAWEFIIIQARCFLNKLLRWVLSPSFPRRKLSSLRAITCCTNNVAWYALLFPAQWRLNFLFSNPIILCWEIEICRYLFLSYPTKKNMWNGSSGCVSPISTWLLLNLWWSRYDLQRKCRRKTYDTGESCD